MWRYSIRELMAVMLAAGMAFAWYAEHRQLRAAVVRESTASNQVSFARAYRKHLESQIDGIDKELGEYGLQIGWSCGHGIGLFASVCKLSDDRRADSSD